MILSYVWEKSLLGGLKTSPNKGGYDPIWNIELIIDKLFCPFWSHVPSKTGLLKPLSLFIRFARVLEVKASMSLDVILK